jgi:phosphohistidine phosphatase
MDLYLIRHAEAVSRDDANYADEERPLTDKGRQQARAIALTMAARNIRFDAVISSPLVRARQTAEIMLQNLRGPLAELQFCEYLAPGGRRRKLIRFLLGIEAESVALIGHEPDLSEFIGRLIGAKDGQFRLAKAGVALVRCDGTTDKDSGTLEWLITPDWLTDQASDEEPATIAANW